MTFWTVDPLLPSLAHAPSPSLYALICWNWRGRPPLSHPVSCGGFLLMPPPSPHPTHLPPPAPTPFYPHTPTPTPFYPHTFYFAFVICTHTHMPYTPFCLCLFAHLCICTPAFATHTPPARLTLCDAMCRGLVLWCWW